MINGLAISNLLQEKLWPTIWLSEVKQLNLNFCLSDIQHIRNKYNDRPWPLLTGNKNRTASANHYGSCGKAAVHLSFLNSKRKKCDIKENEFLLLKMYKIICFSLWFYCYKHLIGLVMSTKPRSFLYICFVKSFLVLLTSAIFFSFFLYFP